MSSTIDHRVWPGKTVRDGESPVAISWHPATFHSLDVAAVALELIYRKPAWISRLGESIGAEGPQLSSLFTWLIALHDIGKLSISFCELLDHELPAERGPHKSASPLRHWEISYQLLIGQLDCAVQKATLLESLGARLELYAAVAGHHGEPPVVERRFKDNIGVPAALAFIEDLHKLLPPCGAISLTERQAKKLSWSLAGLTVVSDWIGSNTLWFDFSRSDVPIEEYWERAKVAAKKAVDESHVGGSKINEYGTFESLFNLTELRPMQFAASTISIDPQPTLYILEDTTGSGKTEAATMLAYRMMCKGLGEGIYVALPTMATANAMYARLGASYRGLFCDTAKPSLALAHGHRHLDQRFRDAVGAALTMKDQHNSPDIRVGNDNATFCGTWISDDKRKAFIAEVGVGTIDQAFMAVLPVRHSVLRLYGLAQRILIVDEAHACDPYMEAELCRLIEMQGTLGGSAVVMTATLTDALRRKISTSYQRGLTGNSSESGPDSSQYPLLTTVTANNMEPMYVASQESARRSVSVSRIDSIEDAVDLAIQASKDGAAVAWIRNTVDDAITAYKVLKERGADVQLFHARFAMHDRLKIENRIVSQFGKKGDAQSRKGKILVATQVIEQSLDLDFDLMLTDLAPIDAIIQRLGRLWRHMAERPQDIRPVPSLTLFVLSADPYVVEDTHWGKAQHGASEYVYGTSLLWKTAKVLFDVGVINSPDGLRDLLDAVVGDTQPQVPPELQRNEDELIGEEYALLARGSANAVKPANGYRESKPRSSEEHFPTRADLDGIRVLLVRMQGDKLVTWVSSEDDPDGAYSEVNVRRKRFEEIKKGGGEPVNGLIPDCVIAWPRWRKESTPILLVGENGRIGTMAEYNSEVGLSFIPEPSG